MQKLEKQFHIHCQEGDVGRYCILPGDPGRCGDIAAYFEQFRSVSQNQGIYRVYRNSFRGKWSASVPLESEDPLPPLPWRSFTISGQISFIRVGTAEALI